MGSDSSAALNPLTLILHARGPVFVVVWLLIAAAILVWVIALLKSFQLRRLQSQQEAFEFAALQNPDPKALLATAKKHASAPGARVVLQLAGRSTSAKLLDSIAKRALVTEQQRATTLMPTLSSIAAASPFVGLFGTVYGILDAFLAIGREKSASLPVVAPAIGEALIATAIGLVAAIPAVVAYNAVNKRIEELLACVDASNAGWVALLSDDEAPMPLRTLSSRPPPVRL